MRRVINLSKIGDKERQGKREENPEGIVYEQTNYQESPEFTKEVTKSNKKESQRNWPTKVNWTEVQTNEKEDVLTQTTTSRDNLKIRTGP